MNKKNLLGIVIGLVAVAIIVIVVMLFMKTTKSIDIKLNENYKSVVGIKVNSDIILVIDNNDKVSNILYLNEESTKSLANQKIEGKQLEKAIELIIDKLKNNNEFNNGEVLVLTKYDNNQVYSKVLENLNKESVIYGIDNKILEETSTLNDKLLSLNLNNSASEIETLYDYSINLLKNSEK